MADAAFIVWLRRLDHVRGRIGDTAADVAEQEAWLKKYFEREGDYYFIVETLAGFPVGTHGIYNVRGLSAEKGRHIVRQDVMAGVPAGLLATDLAFEKLGLRELRASCVSTNTPVRSLHKKSGFKETGVARAAQIIGGKPVDLIQFLLPVEDWAVVRERMVPLAQVAGSRVLDWEKTQLGKRQPWEQITE